MNLKFWSFVRMGWVKKLTLSDVKAPTTKGVMKPVDVPVKLITP
jgi:hypothetical protein